MKIPSELSFMKDHIQNTLKPFVRVDSKLTDVNMSTVDSKFGGRPYYKSIETFPVDSSGKLMIPLAQINFSEVATLEGFPKSGLLQFFVADDDTWGLNPSDLLDQSGFRVIYVPESEIEETKAITKEQHPIPFPGDFFVRRFHRLSFQSDEAAMSFTDFRNELDFDIFEKNEVPDMKDYYWDEIAKTSMHKIGGYAHFGQDDPRYDKNYADYTIQLLQILSTHTGDIDKDISIGKQGRGTIHFFIRPNDLKNLNFENVLYTWETY